ncbi:hypothetical protein GCM10011351_14600 [Paraliobacillus quinghaiensis]|uniref:Amino acid decarboxylase n=1 Tax=Paraliobacillus quinghaiensis TaxID=470815 RepID=A0A917WT38_9BACI|nr:amino acid decarboxylase [Paraliobacillus quinghaiensis]GGM29582.1 hypothetical protein GCM10011351_14600 [Paraliobacillus quinghaiensis]
MLAVKLKGNRAIIDVRVQAAAGEHPGNDILKYVESAPKDIEFEIHVPHEAKPLVKKLEGIGMNVTTNKVDENHYYLIANL